MNNKPSNDSLFSKLIFIFYTLLWTDQDRFENAIYEHIVKEWKKKNSPIRRIFAEVIRGYYRCGLVERALQILSEARQELSASGRLSEELPSNNKQFSEIFVAAFLRAVEEGRIDPTAAAQEIILEDLNNPDSALRKKIGILIDQVAKDGALSDSLKQFYKGTFGTDER